MLTWTLVVLMQLEPFPVLGLMASGFKTKEACTQVIADLELPRDARSQLSCMIISKEKPNEF